MLDENINIFENRSHSSNFTIVLNEAIRDPRLSWRAKGILTGCLSHAAGFKFNKAWIINHGTEGRDAVTAALSELRNLGYLQDKVRRCPETGKVVGRELVFRDLPERPARESTEILETRLTDNQATGAPSDGRPVVLRRPSTQEEQIQEEPPMSPATKQTPEPLNGERRPAPTTPNQSRRKTGRFVAKPNDVPSTLSAVAEEVCEFFNKHKGGQRTERAFQGLLDQLAQINEDECGGIDAIKSQIEKAVTVSKAGEKKWQSILYKNWFMYGRQETAAKQGRSYKVASTVNMQTHPSYRPLVVDEPVTQQVEQVRLIVNRDEEFSF